MTVTTLGPKTALVVIDLQGGVVADPTEPHPAGDAVPGRIDGGPRHRPRPAGQDHA